MAYCQEHTVKILRPKQKGEIHNKMTQYNMIISDNAPKFSDHIYMLILTAHKLQIFSNTS